MPLSSRKEPTIAISDKARWKEWAENLRQEMMGELVSKVTKSVDDITSESGTEKDPTVMQSKRFWTSCQAGKSPNDALSRAGFEIDFEPNDENEVEAVTLRLNDTWQTILQRVLDRKA